MKMKRPVIFLSTLIFTLFLILSICIAAQTLYVTSEDATLKADSSSSSATIMELKRGTELTVVAKDGRWYSVATPTGKKGWIYRGKVSEEPPEMEGMEEDEDEGVGGLLGGLSGSDINADAADSSRSIRGLSPEAKEYADATGSPKEIRNALDAVIARPTTDNEIDRFLQEGKIGEYAE
jgi:uncharacterized protein YgiM (DUF1202 family)